MGLFTGKEEKELKQQQKEQAKAEAERAKIRAKLATLHLEDIDSRYEQSCLEIMQSLMGTGMMEFGSMLTGMKTEDRLNVAYLHAIMDQNWIIIRQLDRIAKLLDK